MLLASSIKVQSCFQIPAPLNDLHSKMADSLLVCAQNVVFPQGNCKKGPFHVAAKRGLIAAIDKCTGECSKCDSFLTCEFLTPGFIDIHNHGMGK